MKSIAIAYDHLNQDGGKVTHMFSSKMVTSHMVATPSAKMVPQGESIRYIPFS